MAILRADDREPAQQPDDLPVQRELERFAYVASHDLREPLRTIIGFLGLLSRRYGDRLDDDGREFVGLAVSGAKRMDALIAELLEYSRSGRHDLPSEPTDLDGAWRVAVRNLSAAIAESGAEVSGAPARSAGRSRGDGPGAAEPAGNAIKYRGDDPRAPRGGPPRRRVGVSIPTRVRHRPAHHEDLRPLQRLTATGWRQGMGLAICKVSRTHGAASGWTRGGRRRALHVRLPAASADRTPEPSMASAARRRGARELSPRRDRAAAGGVLGL